MTKKHLQKTIKQDGRILVRDLDAQKEAVYLYKSALSHAADTRRTLFNLRSKYESLLLTSILVNLVSILGFICL